MFLAERWGIASERMRAVLLRIRGKVQRVGYRRFVQETAQELELAGYVKNEKDGSVTVFIQGDEEKIAAFIQAIKSPPPPSLVKSVEEKTINPKPKIKHFQIRYDKLADELQEGFGAMQSIFTTYCNEFRDFRGEFRDYRGEFRDFRQEFRDFRQEFRELRGEFNDFRQEFREFRKDFDEFVKRMDAFVDRVTKVLEVLTEQSKRSMDILELVARDSKETREMLVESMRLLREVASRVV
ncbi:MAG: acylphosphatase [Candidatus Caldarchaeum sp.]